MKLKPGQVLDEFEIEGHHIVFRTPKRGDEIGCMRHINRLVRDRVYIGRQTPVTLAEEKKWMRGLLRSQNAGEIVMVLVTVDGEIAGSAQVGLGRMRWNRHVAGLGIGLSRARGMGIGTRLMKLMIRLAREHFREVRMIRLSAAGRNRVALRLYRKAGFRECGRIPGGFNWYGKYMDEVLMVRPLRR